ncbi:MAG: hypothetical protein Q4D56_00870 [Bacteroides sp.]|nr:hypothetical protein [Bacteroides sp.]
MKNIILGFILCCLSAYPFTVRAAQWQWSVQIPSIVSDETNDHPRAFLWIPADCRRVNAVVVGQHNMCEETLFENPAFRSRMQEVGMALVWITPILDFPWDVTNGCNDALLKALDDLAEASGYTELRYAPIVPVGHSAMATFPWNFAAWNPERTLAVISYHGDAPRTNLCGYGRANLEWGRTRHIDGIPGLMIEGEYEWWEARVNPALAFRMMYPESCISFLCDAGRGHFDVADRTARYIGLFLQKVLKARLPEMTAPADQPVSLKKLNPQDGWLAERWRGGNTDLNAETRRAAPAQQPKRAKPAPFEQYKGNPHDAFWYIDQEMAELTERIYREEQGKRPQYVSFEQNGRLLTYNPQAHGRIHAPFVPEADGLTFRLKPAFVDSLYQNPSDLHASGSIHISRICGPVRKVNDTTFTVSFYHMGLNNRRRTNEIWLLAEHTGDKRYKSAVQELCMHIPYPQTEGKRQYILFPGLPDVTTDTQSLPLQATSDCGLPVSYYVKEGPAEVIDGRLVFTPIPPRSRLPMKVTVVAWQYGLAGEVQTAEAVERSFYIR